MSCWGYIAVAAAWQIIAPALLKKTCFTNHRPDAGEKDFAVKNFPVILWVASRVSAVKICLWVSREITKHAPFDDLHGMEQPMLLSVVCFWAWVDHSSAAHVGVQKKNRGFSYTGRMILAWNQPKVFLGYAGRVGPDYQKKKRGFSYTGRIIYCLVFLMWDSIIS